MTDTSLTLLSSLQQSNDPETWDRLIALYQPLLKSWLRRYEVQATDADDLVQEVLLAVSKDLTNFDHNGRTGAFRNWLRSILVNRLRNFWKTRGRQPRTADGSSLDDRIQQLEDPASEMSQLWSVDHDRHVARQLMVLTQPQFTEVTWAAFTRVAIDGARPDDVAAELNISLNAVFIAKSRVISRLRQQAEGLLEASSDFSVKG